VDLFGQRHSFEFHTATTDANIYETSFDDARVEVSLIREGAVTFMVDGEERHIEAPAASFQAYRHRLEVTVPRGRRTRTMWCHFSSATLSDAEWGWVKRLPSAQTVPKNLLSLFENALALTGKGGAAPGGADYGRHVRDALGTAIFAEYVRCAWSEASAASLPPAVRTVKTAIDENYASAWTIEQLAGIAGVNGNYLISLFKRHVGESPIRYLWSRRVEAGIQLLQATRLPIEEIAFRCGFQTAAHFSRLVKQRRHRPPSLLRESAR
jgi:AraC-like DNA-binding protein